MRCLLDTHQLREEIANPAIGDISRQGVKAKSPGQRIQERFFQLIPLEMFVTDTLLVDTNSLDGEDAIARLQPPCIQLIVRNDEEKHHAQSRRQAAVDQEDDFPGRDGCAVFSGADRNAICYQTAEDLAKSVEGKPDTCSGTLFLLRPPL